ncbi:hypothetical protein B7H19_12690 [Pseudomonas putida]|nr:hypothetical protein B7H19_12690 [Pseudomonas putida]
MRQGVARNSPRNNWPETNVGASLLAMRRAGGARSHRRRTTQGMHLPAATGPPDRYIRPLLNPCNCRLRQGHRVHALVFVVVRKSSAARAAHREQARSYIGFGPVQPAPTRAIRFGPVQPAPTRAIRFGPVQPAPTRAIRFGPVQPAPTRTIRFGSVMPVTAARNRLVCTTR